MEPIRDEELRATLEALRPAPRPAFTAELDARVAAGFPRRSRLGEFSPLEALDRLRALKPRRVLLPAGAFALTAILAAAAVISLGGSNPAGPQALETLSESSAGKSGYYDGSGSYMRGSATPADGAGAETVEPLSAPSAAGGAAFDTSHRAVERSAEITLGTEPGGVGDAAAEVFDVVHAQRGIVLRSSTSDGAAGEAAAEFELLIPSARLGDAMAAFSRIAEVRSRHEATADITAPTVGAAEHLEDSQARIDGLLAQLAAADTEGEREAVEAELRGERRRAAGLRAQLQSLERRANLSRVSLHIESGEAVAAPDEGGAWGVGDALEDAGRILAVAAAVLLVALAILAPFALLALLAWLARRTYLRRARRQALS